MPKEASLKEAIIALPTEHIRNGNFIWYHGFTSTSSWNCPAAICDVNLRKKTFHVISLDDMVKQDTLYHFHPNNPWQGQSRLNMRAATKEEAAAYVKARRPEPIDWEQEKAEAVKEVEALQNKANRRASEAKRLGLLD